MSGIIGNNIVRNGLVLHLNATDRKSYPGSGTIWYDRSGNNNHFTLYNSPTFNSSYGGELRFDGVNDYARNRNNTIINSIAANGTVEIWYRSYDNSFGSTNYSRLISIANDTGTGSDTTSTTGANNDYTTFFCLARNILSNYFILVYKNSSFIGSTALSTNDNAYYQSIFSWSTSGANMTFNHYVNAINQTTNTYALSNFSGANNITIGMNCNGAVSNVAEISKMACSIVRLYSKTLSQTEITQNFNATRKTFNI
jgi:hypothetical protein